MCLRSSSSRRRTSIFQELRRDSKNRRWVITFYLNASDYFNYSKEYFQTQSASLSYIYDGCYANLCKTSHSISPIKGLWHPTCCWYMWSLDSHIKYTGGLPPRPNVQSADVAPRLLLHIHRLSNIAHSQTRSKGLFMYENKGDWSGQHT